MKTRDRSLMPATAWDQTVKTTPVNHAPTLRRDYVRTLSSFKPGLMVPVFAVPLLREDGIRTTRLRFAFDMSETSDLLLNHVRVIVHTYFVSKMAFERFNGYDDLNRSYNKVDGAPAWFETETFTGGGNDQIYTQMGLHAPDGSTVNDDYKRAYNCIWNYRAKQRSSSLELRGETAAGLAPAFWPASVLKHVKPSFDQAMIDGEVPIVIDPQQMPVRVDVPRREDNTPAGSIVGVLDQDGTASRLHRAAGDEVYVRGLDPDGELYAELAGELGKLSLSNIDLARQTVAFARLRAKYQGLSEDWMMDQLLSGIRIPNQALQHPMLLARGETVFGMSQRWATDSGNLDKSVTRGLTQIDQVVRLPRMDTGGVVMAVVEVLPEQIYERMEDTYFVSTDPATLPERTIDSLDPEPVSIVKNSFVDADHTLGDDVFGYAPLNHEWQRNTPRLGGKFFRNAGDTWDENRNRIWTPEVIDPTLGEDFYLATNLGYPVFEDTQSDPFEVNCQGVFQIEGLTYFGPALVEATDDYDSIMARVDKDRIPLASESENEESEDENE